jgi:hypothetical protein
MRISQKNIYYNSKQGKEGKEFFKKKIIVSICKGMENKIKILIFHLS